MPQFRILLSRLRENVESLLAMNDAGDILIARRPKAPGNGGVSCKGVCGLRFQALTGRRLPLTYLLPEPSLPDAFVTAMNNRGEVVGGYPGSMGIEGSHGLFWYDQGRMTLLVGAGAGVAINDAGQIITDETHVTDGQVFGDYAVRLRPGVSHLPNGPLALPGNLPGHQGISARSINRSGAVVGPGMVLWQPGQYQKGHTVEQDSPSNASTPFAGGSHPFITDMGVIVCLGSSPHKVSPEALRFHRWRAGAPTAAIPVHFPPNSLFRQGSGKTMPGAYTLTTVGANARGEVLLNVKGECIVGGKKAVLTESLLWHESGQAERLPHIESSLFLNNRGWILGILPRDRTRPSPARYALLRPL